MPLVGILASEWGKAFEKNRVTKEKNDVMTNREGARPAPERVGFPLHGHARLFGSVACRRSWLLRVESAASFALVFRFLGGLARLQKRSPVCKTYRARWEVILF